MVSVDVHEIGASARVSPVAGDHFARMTTPRETVPDPVPVTYPGSKTQTRQLTSPMRLLGSGGCSHGICRMRVSDLREDGRSLNAPSRLPRRPLTTGVM